MRYLKAVIFIIVFSIGNIANLIWKKHMNKVFWSTICALWMFNIYNWYQDPSGTWERITINMQNPWYSIPLGLIGITIIFAIFGFFYSIRLNKKQLEFTITFKKSLQKSRDETDLMRSDKLPTNEDIAKYYKMYCIKFRMDNRDQWTTLEPMPFGEFEEKAKDIPETIHIPMITYQNMIKKKDPQREICIRKSGGWEFLIAQTSDAFSFDPKTGLSTMMRFVDYESLINSDK
jgi:hypothetical protein